MYVLTYYNNDNIVSEYYTLFSKSLLSTAVIVHQSYEFVAIVVITPALLQHIVHDKCVRITIAIDTKLQLIHTHCTQVHDKCVRITIAIDTKLQLIHTHCTQVS
jgi:enhancing lycopene biosynthesis protein 2